MTTTPHPTCFALGYAGDGNYKCSCGELFVTLATGCLKMDNVLIIAVKDQWKAHQAATSIGDAATRKDK